MLCFKKFVMRCASPLGDKVQVKSVSRFEGVNTPRSAQSNGSVMND